MKPSSPSCVDVRRDRVQIPELPRAPAGQIWTDPGPLHDALVLLLFLLRAVPDLVLALRHAVFVQQGHLVDGVRGERLWGRQAWRHGSASGWRTKTNKQTSEAGDGGITGYVQVMNSCRRALAILTLQASLFNSDLFTCPHKSGKINKSDLSRKKIGFVSHQPGQVYEGQHGA